VLVDAAPLSCCFPPWSPSTSSTRRSGGSALSTAEVAGGVEALGPEGSPQRKLWRLIYVEGRTVVEVAARSFQPEIRLIQPPTLDEVFQLPLTPHGEVPLSPITANFGLNGFPSSLVLVLTATRCSPDSQG
jgi:hypothetical protein